MPVVGIPIELLQEVVGRSLDAQELQKTLSRMGCDLEGLQVVRRILCRRCSFISELGAQEEIPPDCSECGAELRDEGATEELPDLEVLRMELLAVRPDLFDPGGLGRALRGYLGLETGLPKATVEEPAFDLHVDDIVTKPTSLRPYIVAAVLEPVRLDGERIKVLMKLQENLHWALGRDRRQASIGVYDLDTVEPPIAYTAEDPEAFSFRPLGTMDADGWSLARILEEHPKGRGYSHLLQSFTHYPILADAQGQVLSMPPIINSEETRVTGNSKRLFVDVTGMNPRAISSALAIFVTSLQMLMPEMRIRAVTVRREGSEPMPTPDLSAASHTVRVSEARRILGLPLERAQTVELLERMRHGVLKGNGDEVQVQTPSYRNDIMHEVDLIEDIAIAYGYDRVPQVLLPTATLARERPVELLSQRAREVLAGLGLVEVVSLVLTNPEVNDTSLGRAPSENAVIVANPISRDQSQLRTQLIPGLLQILSQNRHRPLPQSLFEIGDVTFLDAKSETGAREERHLALAIVHPKAGFAEVKAAAEAIAREFECTLSLEPYDEPPFLPGRGARALCRECGPGGAETMVFGEVHPEVLEKLGISNPVVVLEGVLMALAGKDPLDQDEWRAS
jgi:phenylalanyl-tRNA synthetase beta chain